MIIVSIAFGKWHSSKPVMSGYNQTEVITSSATSQTSANTGTSDDDCVEISVTGGSVWITLDGTTAAAGAGPLLPDGTTRTFDSGTGMEIKVINA